MLLIIILLHFIVINCYSSEKNYKKIFKEISLECDNLGYPKKSTLKSLIAAQYLHSSQDNKISIKEVKGGLYTEKMYLASIKKNGKNIPLFFFKISKKIASTKNLIKIQEGPIGQRFKEYSDSRSNSSNLSSKSMPHIIFLENVFTYKDPNGNKRTIEVTPSAQGKLVQDILDCANIAEIKKASYALGKSLATFHQLFINYNDSDNPKLWKTICHGDFSIKNTLFDNRTNKVYFIDNEGMGEGYISQDIRAMLTSFLMLQYLKKKYPARWLPYLEHCLSFLKGYIESYPIEKRAYLALFIKEVLDAAVDKALHKKIVKNKTITVKEFNEKDFKKTIHEFLYNF